MGDAVKWALLAAAAVALIALVMALPFVEFIDMDEFNRLVGIVVSLCADAFTFGRGLINNFLTSFGAKVFSGLLVWLFGKWAITIAIKTGAWVYHFIFK